MSTPILNMLSPTHEFLSQRQDIQVTNLLHYVAIFSFGRSEVRVHPHAVARLLERQDSLVHLYAGKVVETPEEAVMALKAMIDDSEALEISTSQRKLREKKYNVPATYLRNEQWCFIVHERGATRILRTCYTVSEEEEVQHP